MWCVTVTTTIWLSVCLCRAGILVWPSQHSYAAKRSFDRREIALCPSCHLLGRNIIIYIYVTVSTELWELFHLKKKPSHSKLYSPHRDKGMTQPFGDAFPLVANLWPDCHVVWELKFTHDFFFFFKDSLRAWLPEGTSENVSVFPEQHVAHTGCRPVACWVIPTVLYRASRAFLLNMMFLEWERKFFSPPQNLRHPKPALLSLF